jgi:hypothetical protein
LVLTAQYTQYVYYDVENDIVSALLYSPAPLSVAFNDEGDKLISVLHGGRSAEIIDLLTPGASFKTVVKLDGIVKRATPITGGVYFLYSSPFGRYGILDYQKGRMTTVDDFLLDNILN